NQNTTQTVSFTLTNLSNVAPGDYTIQVQGMDGTGSIKTDELNLNIGEGAIALSTPADESTEALAQGPGGTNTVDYSFLSIDGRDRYFVNYSIFRSGANIFDGGTFVTFGGNPGANVPVEFAVTFPGGIFDNDVVVWSVTARDLSGGQPDVVSCTRSFTFLTVLPVTWIDFTAQPINKAARLNWTVEQDALHAGFHVERQTGQQRTWEVVGYVPAAGPEGRAYYDFLDETVAEGQTYYYRLRQEDTDGQISYSALRTVVFERGGFDLLARPNPTSGVIFLTVGSQAPATLTYEVFNPMGQKLLTGEMNDRNLQLSLAQYPPGIYAIWVSNNQDYRALVKVLKQ
ncbi:MAG: T9SS type A sorting domain-containing protein, partial [Bacteroidota bacterium]